ncbi:M1 family metallopeptidase [Brevundimonas guildfordensis]|uniref:Aminopeptidase N n=1 Tax=Brevundimonas guildfordensis TaxID=2762241 RepID=A0ABR8R1G8_9CAUL|nr:M1 family metallopeptidase [Brevundimonas guildfordensis]MBD7941633.1 M1 family metallopeptidase [Brevundimonas guildfordensis]
MTLKLAGRVSALAIAAALATSLGACATTGEAVPMTPLAPAASAPASDYVNDAHSYARPAEARVTHVDLDLTADFAAKTLAGKATLDVTGRAGATEVVLDAKMLDIKGVTDAAGRPLDWSLGAEDPIKGQPLSVRIPAFHGDETQKIVVAYSTRPDASALQWLSPQQTAGGQKPYLFSQGQAILTRTWIPTQDSPGIRQSYSARITAPADLTVVMSAEQLTPNGEAAGAGTKAWRFKLDNPIPPYLIAVAVGDLAFAPFDARTGVWAEPSQLQASAHELQPTAQMVDAAEALYGPYRWGRYDLLVLPPSFPFGGMENPRLTFATPTIIAGDRSLVSLVAHELAHSWSGNLVTNATWDDFWLNEGFTSYFENRIMEAVYGRDAAVQEQVLAWDGLQDELKTLAPADTRLHLELAGRDPDEGMNTIAYDKGAAFLRTIEQIAGRERFDAWLRGYFERNAWRPMTSERFLEDIRTHLMKGDAGLEQRLQLNAWVYDPGLPSNVQAPVSQAFAPVDAAAEAFYVAKGPASAVPWKDWNTQQRLRFLSWRPDGLAAGADWLTPAQLADLERTLKLDSEGNAELTFAWLQAALANRYEPAVAVADRFLTSQGRRKFVLPLFQTLWAEGDWGRPIATRIYAKARPLYHPVTSNSVDQVVGRP